MGPTRCSARFPRASSMLRPRSSPSTLIRGGSGGGCGEDDEDDEDGEDEDDDDDDDDDGAGKKTDEDDGEDPCAASVSRSEFHVGCGN